MWQLFKTILNELKRACKLPYFFICKKGRTLLSPSILPIWYCSRNRVTVHILVKSELESLSANTIQTMDQYS